MISRALRRRTAAILLCLFAYTQAALAATYCHEDMRSPVQAVTESSTLPCHETSAESQNGNLCQVHCQSELQSLDKPSVNVHAMPATPVLSVPLAAVRAEAIRTAALSLRNSPDGAPPPQFLLQVIRQ
jgi:hypothetical protein